MTSGDLLWRVIAAALLVVGGLGVGSWLAGAVGTASEQARIDPFVRRLLVRATPPATTAVAVVVALGVLQIDLMPAAVVVGAVLLGGGTLLREPLSNAASGAVLVTTGAYRQGERIRCSGAAGTVLEQGLFALTLEDEDGTLVTLSNNVVLGGPIHNDSRGGPRRLSHGVFANHGVLLADHTERLLAAALAVDGVLDTPAPAARVEASDEDGVWIEVRVWAEPSQATAISDALGRALAGVELQPAKPAKRGPA